MEPRLPDFFLVGAVKAGTTALHLFLDQHPEIALLAVDIQMPRMDGIEFVAEVRKRPNVADIPVVFISAASEAATVRRAVALKPAGYILKPVLEPSRVLDRVDAALRSSASILEDSDETCRRLGINTKTHVVMLEALAAQVIEARPALERGPNDDDLIGTLIESTGQLGAVRLASKLAEFPENRDVSGVLHETDALLGELSLRGIRPAQEWKQEPLSPAHT